MRDHSTLRVRVHVGDADAVADEAGGNGAAQCPNQRRAANDARVVGRSLALMQAEGAQHLPIPIDNFHPAGTIQASHGSQY